VSVVSAPFLLPQIVQDFPVPGVVTTPQYKALQTNAIGVAHLEYSSVVCQLSVLLEPSVEYFVLLESTVCSNKMKGLSPSVEGTSSIPQPLEVAAGDPECVFLRDILSPAETATVCEVSAPEVAESDIVKVMSVAKVFLNIVYVFDFPDPGATFITTLKFCSVPATGQYSSAYQSVLSQPPP
jgi:hypothetical protein